MTRSRGMLPSTPTLTLRCAAAVAGFLTLIACGSDGGAAGSDTAATAVAAGQDAFESHCMTCHGPQAQGTGQGPPLVHIVYEPSHHGDDAFRSAVAEGVTPHHWDFGPMPPVSGISDAEVEAVIAYVRRLQREAGIE